MKTLIVAISLFFVLTLDQKVYAQNAASTYSQKMLLKNWALSRCLAQVYADEKTRQDANETASAFLEFGRQPIEAYEAIDKLVEAYAQRKYSGSIMSNFNTMKCIDLLNSSELDTLARKFSRSK